MPKAKRLPFSLDPLDPNFVAAKPRHSIKEEEALALEQKGRLIITRKRDGYRHYAVILPQCRVRIYTRGIEDVTDKYSHIAEEVAKLSPILPVNTVLDGEMVYVEDGKDNFQMLTTVAKTKGIHPNTLSHVRYVWFDVVVLGGKVNSTKPFIDRLEEMVWSWIYMDGIDIGGESKYVESMEQLADEDGLRKTFEEAKKLVKEQGWEGLVLYDSEGKSNFRVDGKSGDPPRPYGCWKWKPIQESDFIVREWERGTGRNRNRMGKLFLLQINSETGREVSCGEVGTGFSDKEREFFAKATYPLVVEVKFEKRFPSGALRHPRFMRLREDKRPEECILSK